MKSEKFANLIKRRNMSGLKQNWIRNFKHLKVNKEPPQTFLYKCFWQANQICHFGLVLLGNIDNLQQNWYPSIREWLN